MKKLVVNAVDLAGVLSSLDAWPLSEALSRRYEYYDPIHTLPEAGQAWWREHGPSVDHEAAVQAARNGLRTVRAELDGLVSAYHAGDAGRQSAPSAGAVCDASGHGREWISGRGASACATIRPATQPNPAQLKAQIPNISLVATDSSGKNQRDQLCRSN